MPKDKPVIVKPTSQQVKQHGNLPEKAPMVPLTSGDKKPRGWYIYMKQAVCIANSRGVAKGITASPKKKSRKVTAVVITDPHYVDYNPPPEPPVTFGPVLPVTNPFEYKDPVFIDSSSVEEPAHACDPKILRRR